MSKIEITLLFTTFLGPIVGYLIATGHINTLKKNRDFWHERYMKAEDEKKQLLESVIPTRGTSWKKGDA